MHPSLTLPRALPRSNTEGKQETPPSLISPLGYRMESPVLSCCQWAWNLTLYAGLCEINEMI